MALDVPTIQALVGAKVNVKTVGSSNGTLTYSGQAPVTFGFIVDEIDYDGTRWSLRGAAPSGAIAFSAGAAGTPERCRHRSANPARCGLPRARLTQSCSFGFIS